MAAKLAPCLTMKHQNGRFAGHGSPQAIDAYSSGFQGKAWPPYRNFWTSTARGVLTRSLSPSGVKRDESLRQVYSGDKTSDRFYCRFGWGVPERGNLTVFWGPLSHQAGACPKGWDQSLSGAVSSGQYPGGSGRPGAYGALCRRFPIGKPGSTARRSSRPAWAGWPLWDLPER